ncbi:MAG: C-terminal target protein [Chlorobi bacterium]|nr:C-terminal target protein [Chlorobiota bacterium]
MAMCPSRDFNAPEAGRRGPRRIQFVDEMHTMKGFIVRTHARGRAVMRSIAAGCLLALMPAGAMMAQSYSLGTESGTYQDLQGGTRASIEIGDSVHTHFIDLGGAAFSLFRRPYWLKDSMGIQITGYGNLRIDNDTSLVIVDGIFGELVSRDASSGISYVVEGGPGNLVVKVQWKNAGFRTGTASDSANFQVWLYQKTGVIEIRIGPGSAPGLGTTVGAWMGTFISPQNFDYIIEKCWIVGDLSKPTFDVSHNFTFNRIKSLPASGTILRLTPRGSLGMPAAKKHSGMIDLSPNPTGDRVTLRIDREVPPGASLRVTDVAGHLVREEALRDGNRMIDLSAVPSGVYIVAVDLDGDIYSGKVIRR